MKSLYDAEIKVRNKIEDNYNIYIGKFYEYHNKLLSIIKYMFINIHNHDYIIKGNEKEQLNKFMKKMFDKVYILNGKSQIENYFEMKEKICILGNDAEFINTYELNSPETYIEYIDSESEINFEIWCHLKSLSNVLTLAKINKYNKTVILDNNAYFTVNFFHMLKYNKNLYKSWDIILFSDINKLFDLKSFVIKQDFLEVMLNTINNILIDNEDLNININNISVYPKNINIINNTLQFNNIITITNLINSNITHTNIDEYRKKEEFKNIVTLNNLYKKKKNYLSIMMKIKIKIK
jgi:hypothetical protein